MTISVLIKVRPDDIFLYVYFQEGFKGDVLLSFFLYDMYLVTVLGDDQCCEFISFSISVCAVMRLVTSPIWTVSI